MASLTTLPRYSDGLSFIYLERAVLEREAQSVTAIMSEGRVSLPAANMACLLLGPGTRITHSAVGALADAGCCIIWCGEGALKFYASGRAKAGHSKNLELQARQWADPELHMKVVRRMYGIRFGEVLSNKLSLQQIRGREGARVREAYRLSAEKFGIEWNGRNYSRDNWQSSDPVNRALSSANAALYSICLAGVISSGFSPGLGFIHQGKPLSFIYDIADLYKLDLSIPAAFAAASNGSDKIERAARSGIRDGAYKLQLLDRIVGDLKRLYGSEEVSFEQIPLPTAELWDPSGNIRGGVSYGNPRS